MISSPQRTHSWTHELWRRAVFARDEYTCQECGETDRHFLCAHHVFPWADFPEHREAVWNGITLCYACHAKVHPGMKFLEVRPQDTIYVERECPECGKKFLWSARRKRQKIYCSIQCHNADLNRVHEGENNPNWKGGMVTEPCPICGEAVKVLPCAVGRVHCCSRSCSGKYNAAMRNQSLTGETHKCLVCGKAFYVKLSAARKGHGKYCSRACFYNRKGVAA
jgi:endogenous inhibitor of DNA gyrase (YacG/DUF329 family)